MNSFKDFYKNYKEPKKTTDLSDEDKFFEAIGTRIPSLNAFTAWLVLNNKIKPYVMDVRTDRPQSLFNVPGSKRILHIVNSLPNVKTLAEEFTKKWK
jgi:hypothetical protein